MTAYENFEHSIASTRSLTNMYSELRRERGLGPRGRLPPGNEDLLWLPRSAVVVAIASLDAYIHAVLYDWIPRALRRNPIPEKLCEAMANIVAIKDSKTFRRAFPLISGKHIHDRLTNQLKTETLAFQPFQTPNKITFAYALIGYENVFVSVSNIWPGPRTSDEDIKRQLSNYVRRRNQIAHEGDREANGAIRHMQPQYAKDCADFIENLVSKLDRVVYE